VLDRIFLLLAHASHWQEGFANGTPTLKKKYGQSHAKFSQWDKSKSPSTIFHGHDLAKWLERLTANAEVLSPIPASSDTVESEGRR
jgi:hypothetical protein